MKKIVLALAAVSLVVACAKEDAASDAQGLPNSPVLQPVSPEERALAAFHANDHVKAKLADTGFGEILDRKSLALELSGNGGFFPGHSFGNFDYLAVETWTQAIPDSSFHRSVAAIVTLKGGQAPLVRLAKIEGKGEEEKVAVDGADAEARALDAFAKSKLVEAATPKTQQAGDVTFADAKLVEVDGACSFFIPGIGCTRTYLVVRTMTRSVPDASWTTSVSALVTVQKNDVTVQIADVKPE